MVLRLDISLQGQALYLPPVHNDIWLVIKGPVKLQR